MKVCICNWGSEHKTTQILNELGFELGDLEISMVEMFFRASKILDKGLNVMIVHDRKNGGYILAVDTKRFGQR